MTSPTGRNEAVKGDGVTVAECPFGDDITMNHTTLDWALGRTCRGCGLPVKVTVEHTQATRLTSYDGPDPSVECAYDLCTIRLRKAAFLLTTDERQWCSKAHRAATLNTPTPRVPVVTGDGETA